ncbi:MAG: cytochrome c oxidase subunit 3, partial [bacterium]|nr:cytochrome c oxidase subunit 3 [bacterium]
MSVSQTESESHAVHRDDVGSKIGMWLFLYTELILFGGLFLLYAVYRYLHPEAFHEAAKELNVVLGAVNTLILLTSSFTMVMSIAYIGDGEKKKSMVSLGLTIVLGLAFLVNKYFEWSAKIHHGIYPNSPELAAKSHGDNLFYGLYYAMTGLHGVHVVIGVIVLFVVLVYVAKDKVGQDNFILLDNSGLYWHLV